MQNTLRSRPDARSAESFPTRPSGHCPNVQCVRASGQRSHRTIIAAAVVPGSSNGEDARAGTVLSRRQLGAALVLAPGLMSAQAALAAEGSAAAPYTDPVEKFTINVPAGWEYGETALPGNSSFSGASGERRTLAWWPSDANPRDVNVSLTITNVSVEFTKLGSFGSAFQFGTNLVNTQDRSYQLKAPAWAPRPKEPVQIAKLLDAKEYDNRYLVEYTLEKAPEKRRHLYTVLMLGYNGMYNRLFTVTAQCHDDEFAKYKDSLLSVVNSIKPPVGMQQL